MTDKETKNTGDDKNATAAIDSAPPTLRTALLRGETVPYLTVPYEVIDGLAVAQGDIVLGTDEDVQRHTAELAEEIAAATAGPGDGLAPGEQALDLSRPAPITPLGNVHAGAGRRWPRGVVPYSIDPSVNADSRAAITQAIRHWHKATRLAFHPRTTSDQDWVLFTHTPGICRSAIGRKGSEQLIEVSQCGTSGTIHEIGHAVGLWHEQSRSDRDAFVIIRRENIIPGKESNFDKAGGDGDDIGPYDFASIMHYSSTEFVASPTPTQVAPRRPWWPASRSRPAS
ncbi:M12 family metallopeptidase [Streptomyces avermitilis]|uniref:M12 family metallopeptidase n=1 Tax=Streptomyces avermitilis TaxID=33903 RepID=UPI0033AF67AE